MTTITQLILLLQVVTQLLTTIQQRPQLPPAFRQTVISQAQKVIELAQKAITEEQQKTVRLSSIPIPSPTPSTATSSSYRIESKPNYDFSELANLIHVKINEERAKQGFGQLTYNIQLSQIAKEHSEDQINDNLWSTDLDKPCSYIFIRHEGLGNANFSLGDRLKNAFVSFREARENIAGIAISKHLTYRRNTDQGAVKCPEFSPAPIPEHVTSEEAQPIIRSNIALSKEIFEPIAPVLWVNREWLENYEIASQAVTGWLNSPGHKENLLAPNVTEAGIGIALINDYAIITQDFIKR